VKVTFKLVKTKRNHANTRKRKETKGGRGKGVVSGGRDSDQYSIKKKIEHAQGENIIRIKGRRTLTGRGHLKSRKKKAPANNSSITFQGFKFTILKPPDQHFGRIGSNRRKGKKTEEKGSRRVEKSILLFPRIQKGAQVE